MKKIIVTGASGFIGSHTLPLLKERGYDVHAITSKETTVGLKDDLTWHAVDILDADLVKAMCRNIKATYLLHLGWYANPGDRMTSEKNVEWVEATLHLARQFAANGGERFVMGGSCAEYDWQYGYCNENLTPTNPQSIYGECKVSVHKILERYCPKIGISYACGRIFFVYGPQEEESRLAAYAIRSLILRKKARLSHGNQMRDYMHVADVADALVTVLTSSVKGAVNIGSGRAFKVREIIDLVGKKLHGLDLLEYGTMEEKFDFPLVVADITKLRDELGWIPAYDLDCGIDDTIKWWKNELNVTTA